MTYWYLLLIALIAFALAVWLFRLMNDAIGRRDTIATVALVTGMITGFTALGSAMGFAVANLDRAACLDSGKKTGTTVEYRLISGCYIQIDGRFIPYDRWVQVSGTNAP